MVTRDSPGSHPAVPRASGEGPPPVGVPLPGEEQVGSPAAAARMDVLRALGDPVRWALLEHLSRRPEVARTELLEALGLAETRLSYHLRVLSDAGLVTIRKQGRNLYCTASRPVLARLEREIEALLPVDGRERGTPAADAPT